MNPHSRLSLADLGEFGLIERLTRALTPCPAGVVGPGDDCAVTPTPCALPGDRSGGFELFTTDTLVENRHFRLLTAEPYSLGWKCVAVTLSDIAAMGGTARYVLLTLQLRDDIDPVWLDEIYRGVQAICELFGVYVLGGDIVSASEIALTSTGIGFTRHAPLLRSGALPGDGVWVSGEVGLSAVGLAILEGLHLPEGFDASRYVQAHRQPMPRLALGEVLAASREVTSAIDISDGLLQDAGQLACSSKVGIEFELERIPRPTKLPVSVSDSDVLTGGEDYELLFTARPEFAGADGVTRIGRVVESTAGCEPVTLCIPELGIVPASKFARTGGFDHFRR